MGNLIHIRQTSTSAFVMQLLSRVPFYLASLLVLQNEAKSPRSLPAKFYLPLGCIHLRPSMPLHVNQSLKAEEPRGRETE